MSANHPFICRNDTFLYVQFSFLKHCAYDLVRFRHKKILVRDRKRSYFRLPGSVGANMAEKCPPCHVKVSGLVATDKAGKCPDVS